MSVRLVRRRNGFGLWLAIVLGSYRIDAYWEPINGWRHLRFRWPLTVWIGPLLVSGQNWQRKQEQESTDA